MDHEDTCDEVMKNVYEQNRIPHMFPQTKDDALDFEVEEFKEPPELSEQDINIFKSIKESTQKIHPDTMNGVYDPQIGRVYSLSINANISKYKDSVLNKYIWTTDYSDDEKSYIRWIISNLEFSKTENIPIDSIRLTNRGIDRLFFKSSIKLNIEEFKRFDLKHIKKMLKNELSFLPYKKRNRLHLNDYFIIPMYIY